MARLQLAVDVLSSLPTKEAMTYPGQFMIMIHPENSRRPLRLLKGCTLARSIGLRPLVLEC